MRKFTIAGIVTAVVGCMFAVLPTASATNIGDQGCTPGYWKTHTDNWFEEPGVPIPTSWLLNSDKVGYVTTSTFASTTLLQALSLKGGPGLVGAEEILLRAAAAAWLNAAHEGVGYPYRRWGAPYNIGATVNAAIASADRDQMIAVAAELDAANNLGCPLN